MAAFWATERNGEHMNTRTKIAAGGVVIAVLAATATPALAASTAASPKGRMHSALATATARLHVGPLAALVTAGTITQTQADSVETATHTAVETAEVANLNAGLAALVADGTITQAQADAAKASLSSSTIPGPREHANLSAWTTTQRTALRAWLIAHPVDRSAIGKSAVATLVTAGTISQAQADAINAAFAAAPVRGMDGDGGHRGHRGRGHGMGGISLGASGTASVSTNA